VLVASYNGDAMARLNQDGTYDPGFNPQGVSVHRTAEFSWPIMVLASDAKILVSMPNGDLELSDGAHTPLVRLFADGRLDPSFRCDAPPFSLDPPIPPFISVPDGGALVSQMRIKSDGSVDTAFKPMLEECSSSRWQILALQPDGRILVRVTSASGCDNSVVRILADGRLDPEFHSVTPDGGIINVQVLADNRILVSGGFLAVNGVGRSRVARLKSDGNLDDNFVPFADGWSSFDVGVTAVQGDGKVLLGGRFMRIGATEPLWLVRLNPDGSWDPSFSFTPTAFCCPLDQLNLDGYSIRSLLVHPDGSLWITTDFFVRNDFFRRSEILRLHGDIPVIRLSVPSLVDVGNRVEVRVGSDAADGRRVVLETAPSLIGAWQPIATNTLLSGTVVFTDTAVTNFLQRFYRASLL
jgi:uncharacterized delta-60 repeat protein